MQVMNTREFEQDHILVGRKGQVGKATVTNDPILMSMLSTGLYANPLKSMVQEITFNAWDAHRMGKCLDKPIDIYFNDTTGLIIRDYGPGIPPGQTFTDIYFTYGGSTKRDDDDATGGFGLGSKSPFAYNDTFTVTNHHNGEKHMYIMHRVHEDNNGGPGHTPIIEGVPTTEKGLMITVGFKSHQDKVRAYEYLKEILYMSGIKAVIHFEGEGIYGRNPIPPTQLITSESLAPGQFIQREDDAHGMLYAVYGGVSYEIPKREEYLNDFEFLQNISRKMGDIYIGFAPNTLTPLPTREGLNMSERSLESVTAALETIQEHFMNLMVPVTKTMMLETLRETRKIGLQPHFVHKKWSKLGTERDLEEMVPTSEPVEVAMTRRNPTQDEATWDSLCRLIFKNTRYVFQMIGRSKMQTSMGLVWSKIYPEHSNWRHALMDPKKDAPELILLPTRNVHHQWGEEFISMWKDLCVITEQELEPRFNSGHNNSKWDLMTNIRAAGGYNHITHSRKLNIIKRLDKENKLKVPTKPSKTYLWEKKNGSQIHGPMMMKTVIVAKTLAALNKTNFNQAIQEAMIPNITYTGGYGIYNAMNWESWCGSGHQLPVASFVIHKKKGQYDAAVQHLKDNGWNVIEADEPEPVYRASKVKPSDENDGTYVEVPEKPKGYPKVFIQSYKNWEHPNEYIQKPSTYLYLTKAQVNSYTDYPNKDLVRLVQKYAPNMVLVNNKRVAEKLDKQGVLSMWKRLDKIAEDILSDKERLKKIYMHYYLHQYSEFPKQILKLPQMQKLMGVPYIRTKESEKFFRDLKFLQFLAKKDYYRNGRGVPTDLRDKVNKALKEARRDDSLFLVRKMNNASKLFSNSAMDAHVSGLKPGERKSFVEKLARFLRTV